ncbi:MAG: hypothetical protein JWN69_561 [Alphaproteobacteria bacterium]|nr:hypothetical protein [Alphaproteobacteria bacterium]
MIVAVDLFGAATLRDLDNFTDLRAVAQAAALPGDISRHDLSEFATAWDAEHVWIRVAWLSETSGASAATDRLRAFDAMIDYARGKNWVDERAGSIRAHWEWGTF